nr:hypothetical protein [Spirochaetaceae bacterium]
VLEYANVYFVRDGNHRVSVAKSLKREFIRAKITHLGVPYRLHKRFTRNNLEDFKHLLNFHNKTGFLNYIPEAKFDIKRLQSWEILEKEINCWNPSWYERHNQETGDIDRGDQQRYWYSRVYSYILNHIKKASLHYLFPGWGNGDVALEMIRLWNSFPEPDNFTIEDMYEIFLKRTKRIKFFLAPFRYVLEKIDYLRRTSFDERCIFLDMSNIKEIRPDFRLPADLGKAYWRKLHFELFRSHFHKMKRRMGRSPYLNELVEDWYDHVWLPRTD